VTFLLGAPCINLLTYLFTENEKNTCSQYDFEYKLNGRPERSKLRQSDNNCQNYRCCLVGILFLRHSVYCINAANKALLLYSFVVLLHFRDYSAVNIEFLVSIMTTGLIGLKVRARVQSLGLGSQFETR